MNEKRARYHIRNHKHLSCLARPPDCFCCLIPQFLYAFSQLQSENSYVLLFPQQHFTGFLQGKSQIPMSNFEEVE